MNKLSRLEYDIHRLEEKLNSPYREMHEAVVRARTAPFLPESRRLRWLSASVWKQEQQQRPEALSETLPGPEAIHGELAGEVRAIVSDYGTLCLEGFRLFFVLLAGLLLFQDTLDFHLNLWLLSELAIGCMVLYPISVYTFWNRGAIHPFKGIKLLLGAGAALSAMGGVYLLSLLERQNPFFEGAILSPFNFTEFLILANLAVLLSFVLYYRQANLFSDVSANYPRYLVSLSGLSPVIQNEILGLMRGTDAVPLKTQTRRKLKFRILEAYIASGRIDEAFVKRFIKIHCIDMNWLYWSGSTAQWTILVLLGSKLFWVRDSGLMVSADYFRQDLTVGAVFGALLMSGAVFGPLNRSLRVLLYQDAQFTLKQVWLMMGLTLLCVLDVFLSGLVPSRFIWGPPVNPAPHPWGFVILLGLVLLLQFFKTDQRIQETEG